MEQRKKTILIIAVIVAVIGILALFLRPRRSGAPGASQPAGALGAAPIGSLSRSGGITNGATAPVITDASPPPPPAETAVRQVAMTFAERYGGYSSEGDFVNITDLYPLMTERYQRQSEAEVVRLRARPRATEFSSTMTVMVNADVELSGGEASRQATARVLTQRTDVRGGVAPRTYGQTLTVQLLKVGEEWRVDGAKWGAEAP